MLLVLEEKLGLADKFGQMEKAITGAEHILNKLKAKYPADAIQFDRITDLLGSVKL